MDQTQPPTANPCSGRLVRIPLGAFQDWAGNTDPHDKTPHGSHLPALVLPAEVHHPRLHPGAPEKLFDGDEAAWVLLVHADGERSPERVDVASDTGPVGGLLDRGVDA